MSIEESELNEIEREGENAKLLFNEEEEQQLNARIKYYEDYIEKKFKTSVVKLKKKCKSLQLTQQTSIKSSGRELQPKAKPLTSSLI